MSDATTALAAAQAAAASSSTASEAADFAAEKAVEVSADKVAASGYADAALDSAANADSSADLAAISEANAASSATTATAKASEAAASATHADDMAGAAEAVAVSNDTIIAGRINDPASATSGALSATYAALNPNALVENLPSPFFITHRGHGFMGAEHTMSAYRMAVAAGADAIELDVQALADGVLVSMHDTSVDRTTDGTGLVSTFNSLAWSKLVSDTAGQLGGTGWPTEGVPYVEQILREFGNRVCIAPQIYSTAVLNPLDALVVALGIDKRTIFVQSFAQADVLAAVALGYPAMQLGNTPADFDLAALAAGGVGYAAIAEGGNTSTFCTNAHAAGLKVIVFSPNGQWKRAAHLALGADGFFTDDVAYMKDRSKITRTSDNFVAQAWYPGQRAVQGTRGKFYTPNAWGWDAAAGQEVAAAGFLKPTDPSNYALTFDANITSDNGTNTNAFFVLLMNDDFATLDSRITQDGLATTNHGYRFGCRANNTLEAIRYDTNGAKPNMAVNIAVTGFALNTWKGYKVTVTPTTIRWERSDGTGGQTFTESVYRPLPYILFGRTGAGVQFRNVAVT